jgi:hypothetical protein
MNCAEWQERIVLHAGGERADGVEAHLAECAECRVFWSEMRESVEDLRSLHGEEIDAAHYTAVRARVMGEIERSHAVWRRLAWISGVAALVMAAILWPRRETPVAVVPRMVAAIPSAPLVMAKHASKANRPAPETRRREPLTVRLETSDPNIVIYWIAD